MLVSTKRIISFQRTQNILDYEKHHSLDSVGSLCRHLLHWVGSRHQQQGHRPCGHVLRRVWPHRRHYFRPLVCKEGPRDDGTNSRTLQRSKRIGVRTHFNSTAYYTNGMRSSFACTEVSSEDVGNWLKIWG